MSEYTSVSAIQSEFKSVTFTTTSAVTTDDVNEFINQEEAALESEVCSIYSVPIVSDRGVAMMKLMATLMVKARIVDILQVKTGDAKADQASSGQPLRDRVKELMDKIISKKVQFSSDEPLVQSSGGVQSYASSNDLTPEFRSGEDQW